MKMKEDRTLKAPSLLELSAEVIAGEHKGALLYANKAHGLSSPSPSSSSLVSTSTLSSTSFLEVRSEQQSSTVKLPTVCGEKVLGRLCENLRADDSTPEVVSTVLRPFMNGEKCPVRMINFGGLNLSNGLAMGILSGQQNTLTCLDLSLCKGLNSTGLCPLLMESCTKLVALKWLRVTSTDLLRVPKPRQNSPPHSGQDFTPPPVRYNLSSLPVVSEKDLPGAPFEHMSRLSNYPRNLYRDVRKIMEGSDDWEQLEDIMDIISTEAEEDAGEDISQVHHFVEFCPNLEQLVVNLVCVWEARFSMLSSELVIEALKENSLYNVEDEAEGDFFTRIFSALPKLRTVDLSEWKSLANLSFLKPEHLPALTTLVLYDVLNLNDAAVEILSSISTLRCLDISQSDRSTGLYAKPVSCLNSLVVNLPHLQYLDISGTNLVAPASENDRPFRGVGTMETDIAGLSFLKSALRYLGIFNCQYAANFQKIPAERVAGEHGEQQILQALEAYVQRPKMMELVLNESYQLYRFSTDLKHYVDALYFVLEALERHPLNSTLQIAGSASLFYIIRHVKMNRDTKRRVIVTLVKGMENHMDESVLVRNCCLSLCQFDIPLEILFNYRRVAQLLVRVLEQSSDQLTQRIIVFLLNSMACHVEGDQKVEVGNIGAIEVILEQIRRKHGASTCDDVMEVGWSFLWNITDETPTNCSRFLDAEGLKLFQDCYAQFPNELELVRNMMGLIGNIAEVESLRSQLMEDSYIRIFNSLLDMLTDGIEISYNSAGVLAHLVSDGVEAWKAVKIPRDYIMKEIARATRQWDLNARRFINYRSFKPILRLVPLSDAPGSQHWAVWALVRRPVLFMRRYTQPLKANLTSTDPKKYCCFILEEGGEKLLVQIVLDERTNKELYGLAQIVLDNMAKWRRDSETKDATPTDDTSREEPGDVDMRE